MKVASCQPFSEDLIAYGADLGPKLYDMYEKPGTDHGGASSGEWTDCLDSSNLVLNSM